VCDRERTSLQPILHLIYQIYNGELTEEEANQQYQSLTGSKTTCPQLFRGIRKFATTRLAYVKWIIKQLPFPSTAHFEFICFGRRIDKRSKWGKLSNSLKSIVLSCAKSLKNRPTYDEFTQAFDRVESNHPREWEEVSKIVIEAIFSSYLDKPTRSVCYVAGLPDTWFVYEPKKSSVSRAEPSTSHRGWSSTANHNIRRFANWIRTTVSDTKRAEIAAIYRASSAAFKSSVNSELSDEERELWRFETSQIDVSN